MLFLPRNEISVARTYFEGIALLSSKSDIKIFPYKLQQRKFTTNKYFEQSSVIRLKIIYSYKINFTLHEFSC